MTADWKCPAGTRVLPADAPRAEWLKARRTGIGASEIASILGIDGAYESPYAVWRDKTSTTPVDDNNGNELLRMGLDIEDVVARRFTEETGIAVRRHGLVRSKKHPHLLASVDRLAADGGIVECKVHTSYAKANADWADEVVPEKFWWQGQQQTLATGRSHVWFAALQPGIRFTIVGVDADPAAHDRIIRESAEFWQYVETGTEPPIDPLTATDEELLARWPHVIDADSIAEAPIPAAFEEMAGTRAALKAEIKDAEARLKTIDAHIKAAIGDRRYLAAGGRPIFDWREVVSKRFDSTAFKTEHPDVYEQFVRESSYRALYPVAQKASKAA